MFLRCAVVYRTALETIDRLTDTLDLTEYASRIIHPLVRTLDTCSELRPIAMDTLTSLVLQLNKKYEIFIPMVSRVIKRHRIVHQRHDIVLSRIQVRAVLSRMWLRVHKLQLRTQLCACACANRRVVLPQPGRSCKYGKDLKFLVQHLHVAWLTVRATELHPGGGGAGPDPGAAPAEPAEDDTQCRPELRDRHHQETARQLSQPAART